MQLMMTMQQGGARVIGNHIDLNFVIWLDVDHVFEDSGATLPSYTYDFEAVPV